jgi:hypothetical protein
MAQNNPGQQLSDLLVTRGYDPEMLDSAGKAAPAAQDAEIFSFDFITANGTNHGSVVVMLGDDKELTVFSGDNVGRNMDSEDKTEWYDFQHQLKNFATKNFMTFGSQNINKLKYSMQGQAALKEGLCESWNGTKNVSWNGGPDSVRLMIRHKRPMGIDEARFRQVESLFVETADGERHRLSFRSLAGGRAMVEHVRQGGKPYDMRGQHIANMVEELNVLSRFRRASKGQVFEGDTANLVAETNRYYETMCRTVKGLSSSKGYNSYFESWNPGNVTEQDLIIEDIKTLFVQETIDSRIEQALPILARIQQQGTAMKEANIFEAWADRLVEGTWATPNTPEQKQQLIELLSQELPVGADATNATDQLYSLFGDDELFDQLQELAETDPDADAREIVIARMTELADSGSDNDLVEVLAALEPTVPEPQAVDSTEVVDTTAPVAEGQDSNEIGPGWKTEHGIVDRVEGNSVIVKTSQGKMRVDINDIKTAEAPEQGMTESAELNTMLKYAGIPVAESRVLDESGETLTHILNRFKHEVAQFEQGGDLENDLYDALYDYYSDKGEIPYGIAKARTGDPFEWITDRLDQELGTGNHAPRLPEGWKGAIAGGLAGGALGSVVPGLGTLAGSALGAYAGHKLGDEGFKDPDAEYKKAQKLKQTPPVAEGPVGSVLGGLAGAALTKTPGGAMAGAKLGSAVGDAVFGSEETAEGQHTQHGMDANAGSDDYEDEKFADIKPMSFRQDPIQATTDRALKYSAQGVNKLRDLFREDEETVVENQDKFSALSGQYGHSGKLQKFDDVEQDVLARLKQLSGMIKTL